METQMIIDTDTITIRKEAVKKYGGLGAIILQELFNYYHTTEIPLEIALWRQNCLDYIPEKTIKRVLTQLRNERKIAIDDGKLIILEKTAKKEKLQEETETPTDRKANPTWAMAEAICRIVGQSDDFLTPAKYLKFAKQLLDSGKTVEFMLQNYGKGGWWYQTQFKGQQGSPPHTQDIRTTVDLIGKTTTKTVGDTSAGFWK